MGARTLVIVNPAAGGGRARRAQSAVADFLAGQGYNAEFVQSQSAEDLRRRAQEAVAAGTQILVALGGDGTFHHLVQATIGCDVVLGFWPAGHGNDIAEGLGIPEDPIAAAHQFLHACPRAVDALEARFAAGHNAIVVGVGGMGLDAEAARLANGRFRRWPGAARYVAGALATLARFRPLELEAEIDDAQWRGRILFAAVASAPCYGAGVRIAPTASMDDGWLDLTLVGEMPWTRLVESIPIVLGSGDWCWEEVRRYRARRVALRAERSAPFHGDGELLGESPVEIRVVPQAIRVRAPAGK
jgi:diacylglycerol kinase (ATP)